MIEEKLGWNKEYKKISILLELFLVIILIICILSKQDLEVLIVMSVLCCLEMLLLLYLNIYSINIHEDKVIIRSILSSKKYEFKSIIVESDVSIRILDLEYKEIFRIANFIDPKTKIYKAYVRYCNTHSIKHTNNNKKLTYNIYVKNFSIFGIAYSFIMFVFSGILIYQNMLNIYNDIIMLLIVLILGIIILIPSVIGILSYVNFEVSINENIVTIKNLIGIEKNYNINQLKCRAGKYIYKLKVTNRNTIILPYYLVDNPNILVKINKY